ncbi:hypothetical protein [Radicibacter daui]|uniref:hypothetical protein n=1 Tax=Radicibacter daui TaxID=3064829 RepID=UPI004046C904
MAMFKAWLTDSNTGGSARYEFEADADLFKKGANKIVKRFMDHVEKQVLPKKHVDYDLNACFKNKEKRVVTAIGTLHVDDDPDVAFMLMISPL